MPDKNQTETGHRLLSRRRLLRVAGLGGAGALAGLSGCAGGDGGGSPTASPGGDTQTDTTTPTPVPKQTLGIGLTTGPTSMDPASNTDTPSRNIWNLIYDPLIGRNANLEFEPRLATDWELVNPTTWEFQLREGVDFSNGEPFNAEVARFNFRRLAGKLDQETNVAGQYRTWFSKIDTVEAPDSTTLQFNLSAPDASFLQRLPLIWMVPQDYLLENGQETLATDPVGTGPYELTNWEKDEQVAMSARDDYFAGEAPFQELIWEPIPESTTRLLRLTEGEVDLIKDIQPRNESRVENNDNLEIKSVPGVSTGMIWLNQHAQSDAGIFYQNPELRKAVNYGIDIDSIIENLIGGRADPLTGWALNDKFLGYDPELEPYPHDPDRAKTLMEEAGYGDGVEATYLLPKGRYLKGEAMAEAIITQLGEVGFDISLKAVEFGRFIDLTLKDVFEHEMFTAFYANSSLSTLDAYNLALHTDAPFSTLPRNEADQPEWVKQMVADIEEAASIADREEADEFVRKIERTVYDNAAHAFLFRYHDIFGMNKRLQFQPREDSIMNMYDSAWSGG